MGAHHEITTNLLIEKQDPLLAKYRERLFEERHSLKQDLAQSFRNRPPVSFISDNQGD
ncbi:hypothetical protein [Neobacillus dielmonensis]|uniref:hypothetical protein n=1 Tax=Neobacillus dielmonensis TaxID=1347369 RepID=UPI000AC25302|nr:hypothetical protein [Neobacillus dielmonensis]